MSRSSFESSRDIRFPSLLIPVAPKHPARDRSRELGEEEDAPEILGSARGGVSAAPRVLLRHHRVSPWRPEPPAERQHLDDQPRTASFTGFADNSYRVLGVRRLGHFGPFRSEHEAKLWPRMASWLGALSAPRAA